MRISKRTLLFALPRDLNKGKYQYYARLEIFILKKLPFVNNKGNYGTRHYTLLFV